MQVIKFDLNLAWQVKASCKQVACMNQIESKYAFMNEANLNLTLHVEASCIWFINEIKLKVTCIQVIMLDLNPSLMS
jgi:hypothetical protein